jgi:cyclophilin family peptidyl-prolyl cis-trans isomerase
MKQTVFAVAGILLVLTGTSAVWAQDAVPAAAETPAAETPAAAAADPAAEPAATPALPEAAPPTPGPKAQAFGELFVQWKKILGELRDLKYAEYPEAGVERRVEISKRYEELVAQGEAMQGDLVAAALEAYKEAPNQDGAISQFLAGIVIWDCQADDYEKALDLAQPLIEHGLKAPFLYGLAGEAAFCTNRFDLAEKYFAEAIRGGAELSEESQAHQQQIGYYKVEWAKEKKIREAEAEADDLPRVEVTTKHGKFIIELFENEAPNTVANFISLVKKGFYDGLVFHRVLPNFMAQGGCPDGTGGGGPGYQIDCECVLPNSRKHFRGSLSMAHAGPNTGGSQFFLCFVPTAGLDGPPSPSHHTVFGRVVEGLDQLAKIKRRDPEGDNPGEPDKIISMKVLRDRGHEYEPKTMPAQR